MEKKNIPVELYSEDSKQPHEHCLKCKSILNTATGYGIQKIYKNYPDGECQVLFDFALCLECMEEARAELSIESRQRIDAFMQERMYQLALSGVNPQDRFEEGRCTLSGKLLRQAQDYQVIALCKGNKLLESPIYLSDDITSQIQELLSAESREELDRFSENNLDWPPELKALIKQGDWLPI